MANRKLTDKQREILEYLKECILQKGYPPAVREICEAVHLKSTSSVHAHLESLEEKGYIRKDPTKPRAIEILDDEFNLARREVINVPIVGTVTCGEPILAEQNIQGYFPIPPEYLHANGKNTFMLKVKGDSMINAGIRDGDLLFVRACSQVQSGEIAVVLISDEEATVKKVILKDDLMVLEAANPEVENRYFTRDEVRALSVRIIAKAVFSKTYF